MNEPLRNFVESLREELKQYGELLALLDLQQQQVIQNRADEMLCTMTAVSAQGEAIQAARRERAQRQRHLSLSAGLPADTAIGELVGTLPEAYRPLVMALVEENNQLLSRVQQRAGQNHVLLSRSVELIEVFINSLCAVAAPTYNQAGTAASSTSGRALYEGIC